MEKRISIIVPIFNVEKYLRRCIRSILSQTFKNLEIILVDDGSTDECPAICEEYGKTDSRIVVIHQNNGGVAQARNTGLDAATGDFIGFIDSDDYVGPKMYETLFNAISNSRAFIAECGYYTVDTDGQIIRNYPLQDTVTNGNIECSREYITKENTTNFNWNKLYRKQLFDDVRYSALTSSEDFLVNVQTFYRCHRKVTVKDCHYYYFDNIEGVCNRPFTLSRLDAVEAGKQACEFYKEKLPELLPYAALYTVSNVLRFYCESACLVAKEKHACRRRLKEDFQMYYPLAQSALDNKRYRKQRWLMRLFRTNTYSYCGLLLLKRKLLKR
jgi:glycosyltransferase involved in cell wall biosynthesis